jgi:D-serine deaminase-like pyridoxal phosphate-dependent protein
VTHAASIDTPAAVVDVDRLERNLVRWQAECDRVGLANRPHVKTHRCTEIARRQLEHGAAGLTCQKLGEAEAMVDAGLDDVLVAYNLLGEAKLERLAALLERATVAVAVDDAALLDGLAGTADRAGRPLGVVVDCDTGLGRTGVQSPQAAAALAVEVARRPGLALRGFLTHPSPPGARDFLERAVEEAGREGLEVRSVSAGGTPAMWDSESLRPVVTEYRAGTYAFHDRATLAAGACSRDDLALTVHATVVSRPTADRALLDAGSKVLGSEPAKDGTFGAVLEAQGSSVARVDEEHAYVTLGANDRLELGDRVRIAPNHACLVPNLFEELVVVSGEDVVDRWRVDARGRSA